MIRPEIPSDGNHMHSLVGGHPGEHLGCVGITPLALLDTLRACSGRNKGCVLMSKTPLGSSSRSSLLDRPHLVSSEVEHEHVSWTARV